MRQITVSTDVYAGIWSARQPGEDTEDSILARVLGLKRASSPTLATPSGIGFSDPRFGITWPEGFEIFRNYKGVEFKAHASGGQLLLLNTGASYPSLNQLSRATSGNVENAWRNWYFKGTDGKRYLVESLRNDALHGKRNLMA